MKIFNLDEYIMMIMAGLIFLSLSTNDEGKYPQIIKSKNTEIIFLTAQQLNYEIK